MTECKICNSKDYVFLDKKISKVENVICKNCGFVYQLSTVYDDESFYKNGTYGKKHGMKIPTKKHVKLMLLRGAPERIKFIEDELKIRIEKMDVLDIGCGAGYELLYLMRERKCNVLGIEPYKDLANFCTSMGLNVINDFFENVTLQNKFDLIIISHTLEHFDNPNLVLQKIKSVMKKDSLVYIEVPNIYKPSGKLNNFFELAHLFNFSPKTLSFLLIKNHYGIRHIDTKSNFIKIIAGINENVSFEFEKEIKDDYKSLLMFLDNYNKQYYKMLPNLVKNKFYFILYSKIYDTIIRILPLDILIMLRRIKNII